MARLNPDNRKVVILNAAVQIAKRDGLHNVRIDTVANACAIETSPYTVKHHFPTRDDLWRAAITHDDSGTLALAAKDMGFS